ncbi:MAG: type II secretion system protein [Candidatus Pacebacteria bacterium]|nr:type II secretion system protein [Candidatus Paceibacterota bacterium]
MKKKISPKGFTLVELLIAISILVILMGVGLVSLRGSQAVARDAHRKAELGEIRSALELYRSDNDAYVVGTDYAETVLDPLTVDGYLESIPLDPRHSVYRYRYSSDGLIYVLCAYLETGGEPADWCGGDCGDEPCNYRVENP